MNKMHSLIIRSCLINDRIVVFDAGYDGTIFHGSPKIKRAHAAGSKSIKLREPLGPNFPTSGWALLWREFGNLPDGTKKRISILLKYKCLHSMALDLDEPLSEHINSKFNINYVPMMKLKENSEDEEIKFSSDDLGKKVLVRIRNPDVNTNNVEKIITIKDKTQILIRFPQGRPALIEE